MARPIFEPDRRAARHGEVHGGGGHPPRRDRQLKSESDLPKPCESIFARNWTSGLRRPTTRWPDALQDGDLGRPSRSDHFLAERPRTVARAAGACSRRQFHRRHLSWRASQKEASHDSPDLFADSFEAATVDRLHIRFPLPNPGRWPAIRKDILALVELCRAAWYSGRLAWYVAPNLQAGQAHRLEAAQANDPPVLGFDAE